MSIQAQGQITLVDIGDLGELSVVPQSNQPTVIVYDPESNTYSPNWQSEHLILTPVIYYGSTSITPSSTTLRWYYQIGTSSRQQISAGNTDYSITNGVLTVLSNILATYNNIAYTVEVDYTEPNTSTVLHAVGQISFAKVSNGNQVKSITITGGNTLLYNSDGTCRNSPVILSATVQNATLSNWQYRIGTGTSATWSNITGASDSLLVVYENATYFSNDVAYLRAVATDSNVYDECSVVKVRDGAPGDAVDSVILSNESQMVPCDQNNDPVTDAFTNCTTTITIYEGNEDHTSEWTISVDTNHGVTGTYNSSTHVFSATGLSATTGYVVFTCTKTDHATLTKTYSLVKVKAGADGQPGTSPTIYTLDVDSLVINKAENGTLTPSVIHLNGYSQTGDAARTAYTGWLKILNANGTVVSSSRASEMAYTVPSTATKLTAQLCASASSSIVYDTQTILMVADGATGSSGANALNFILGNYSDVIPCTSAGVAAAAQTITIPYAAYSGASRIACTASYSTLPSGVTYNSSQSQTGTTARDGKLIFNVASGATFGNASTMTGTITITITASGVSNSQTYTWTKNNKAVDGAQGEPGNDGYNVATIFLYKRSDTAPSAPSGTFTYDFSTGAITPSSSISTWSTSIPTDNGKPCYVMSVSLRSNTTTATFTWPTPVKLVEDGQPGQDGQPYIINVTNDIIYRSYKEDGTYLFSQPDYGLQLLRQSGEILQPDTDYSIIISMLPSMDIAVPETKQEEILSSGYEDLIGYFSNKLIEIDTILTYDTETYTFNLENLAEANASNLDYRAEVLALQNILSTQTVSFLVTFYIDNEIVGKQLLSLNTAIETDLALFTETAKKIRYAQQNARYEFTDSGFVIYNGDFTMLTNNGQDLVLGFDAVNNDFIFNGTVYADNGVFGGTLNAATGTFSGTITAASGDFTGKIIAEEGNIGGFIIQNDRLISSVNGESGEPVIQLIGGDIDNNIVGKIIANDIEIGRGAIIKDYINLGNTSRLFGNSDDQRLLIAGADEPPIGQEPTYSNPRIIINKNGTMGLGSIFLDGINSRISGGLTGADWFVSPTVASFANIVASGKIISSIFEYNKLQIVGGQMAFRPVFEISDFEIFNDEDRFIHLILNTDTELEINDVLYFYPTDASFTPDDGLGARITEYDTDEETGIRTYTVHYGETTTEQLDKIYKYAIHFGAVKNPGTTTVTADNALLLGINSTSQEGILLPKGLTLKEPIGYNTTTETFTYGSLPRAYLGDLSQLEGIILSNNNFKYGLYADNVILNGSLTTRQVGNVVDDEHYAGINTNGPVDSKKIVDVPNNRVVIWAGANGVTNDDIADAPFQVTQDGSIYANKGIFEGSIITKSTIQASALYTTKIYGGTETTEAPLSIYSTHQGINFYNSNNTSEISDDKLTLTIKQDRLTAYNTDSQQIAKDFIIIDSTGEASYYGKVFATSIELGNFTVTGNEIRNKNGGRLIISNTELTYDLYPGNTIMFTIKNGETNLKTDTVNVQKDITFGSETDKLTYKQVTGGYDLFIG